MRQADGGVARKRDVGDEPLCRRAAAGQRARDGYPDGERGIAWRTIREETRNDGE